MLIRPKIKSFKNSNNLCVFKLKMGFFQSFGKKEDVKKEKSDSNLGEMPPPPLPSKEKTEKKEDKNELLTPPQTKEPGKPEPNLEKEPLLQDSPIKQEPITKESTAFQKPQFSPLTEQTFEIKKPMQNQFSPPQETAQPPVQTAPQSQKPVAVPETLPEMPSLSTETKEQSSYTFTQEKEEIPYFTNVNAKEKDDSEELFNLPIIDIEEDTESYGRFKYGELKKPLFIRTDHYSQILTNIDTMKNYVEETSDKISMLNTLKRNADIEHKKYKDVLEDVQRKLIYIDRVLFD